MPKKRKPDKKLDKKEIDILKRIHAAMPGPDRDREIKRIHDEGAEGGPGTMRFARSRYLAGLEIIKIEQRRIEDEYQRDFMAVAASSNPLEASRLARIKRDEALDQIPDPLSPLPLSPLPRSKIVHSPRAVSSGEPAPDQPASVPHSMVQAPAPAQAIPAAPLPQRGTFRDIKDTFRHAFSPPPLQPAVLQEIPQAPAPLNFEIDRTGPQHQKAIGDNVRRESTFVGRPDPVHLQQAPAPQPAVQEERDPDFEPGGEFYVSPPSMFQGAPQPQPAPAPVEPLPGESRRIQDRREDLSPQERARLERQAAEFERRAARSSVDNARAAQGRNELRDNDDARDAEAQANSAAGLWGRFLAGVSGKPKIPVRETYSPKPTGNRDDLELRVRQADRELAAAGWGADFRAAAEARDRAAGEIAQYDRMSIRSDRMSRELTRGEPDLSREPDLSLVKDSPLVPARAERQQYAYDLEPPPGHPDIPAWRARNPGQMSTRMSPRNIQEPEKLSSPLRAIPAMTQRDRGSGTTFPTEVNPNMIKAGSYEEANAWANRAHQQYESQHGRSPASPGVQHGESSQRNRAQAPVSGRREDDGEDALLAEQRMKDRRYNEEMDAYRARYGAPEELHGMAQAPAELASRGEMVHRDLDNSYELEPYPDESRAPSIMETAGKFTGGVVGGAVGKITHKLGSVSAALREVPNIQEVYGDGKAKAIARALVGSSKVSGSADSGREAADVGWERGLSGLFRSQGHVSSSPIGDIASEHLKRGFIAGRDHVRDAISKKRSEREGPSPLYKIMRLGSQRVALEDKPLDEVVYDGIPLSVSGLAPFVQEDPENTITSDQIPAPYAPGMNQGLARNPYAPPEPAHAEPRQVPMAMAQAPAAPRGGGGGGGPGAPRGGGGGGGPGAPRRGPGAPIGPEVPRDLRPGVQAAANMGRGFGTMIGASHGLLGGSAVGAVTGLGIGAGVGGAPGAIIGLGVGAIAGGVSGLGIGAKVGGVLGARQGREIGNRNADQEDLRRREQAIYGPPPLSQREMNQREGPVPAAPAADAPLPALGLGQRVSAALRALGGKFRDGVAAVRGGVQRAAGAVAERAGGAAERGLAALGGNIAHRANLGVHNGVRGFGRRAANVVAERVEGVVPGRAGQFLGGEIRVRGEGLADQGGQFLGNRVEEGINAVGRGFWRTVGERLQQGLGIRRGRNQQEELELHDLDGVEPRQAAEPAQVQAAEQQAYRELEDVGEGLDEFAPSPEVRGAVGLEAGSARAPAPAPVAQGVQEGRAGMAQRSRGAAMESEIELDDLGDEGRGIPLAEELEAPANLVEEVISPGVRRARGMAQGPDGFGGGGGGGGGAPEPPGRVAQLVDTVKSGVNKVASIQGLGGVIASGARLGSVIADYKSPGNEKAGIAGSIIGGALSGLAGVGVGFGANYYGNRQRAQEQDNQDDQNDQNYQERRLVAGRPRLGF